MKANGGKLSRKQEQAIAALLSEPTIAAAAERVGVGEVTLWRWLQREDFRVDYQRARRETVAQAIAAIQQASSEAVQALREIMVDSEAPASSRVSAAKTVLEFALKGAEVEDIEKRVTVLEEAASLRRTA